MVVYTVPEVEGVEAVPTETTRAPEEMGATA
jgi:hypothetical protein